MKLLVKWYLNSIQWEVGLMIGMIVVNTLLWGIILCLQGIITGQNPLLIEWLIPLAYIPYWIIGMWVVFNADIDNAVPVMALSLVLTTAIVIL